jgi:hypothetical protein
VNNIPGLLALPSNIKKLKMFEVDKHCSLFVEPILLTSFKQFCDAISKGFSPYAFQIAIASDGD